MQMGGKEAPSTKDLDKILGSTGLDFDPEKANIVVNALKGKVLQEVIAEGTKKLASVPSGGGAAAAPAAAGGAPKGGEKAAAAAPAKEEKKPEKEEESDEDMGFGLFD